MARSSKVVTLVDLAGHERYFKTTAYGLTGHLPGAAAEALGRGGAGCSRQELCAGCGVCCCDLCPLLKGCPCTSLPPAADYACLIVGANAGVVGMCKEHMGVALALKVLSWL